MPLFCIPIGFWTTVIKALTTAYFNDVLFVCAPHLRFRKGMDQDLYGLPVNLYHLEGCLHTTDMQVFAFFFFFFFFFMATPAVYGSSWAKGQIEVAAAGLCHNHSNTGSEPHL